MEKRDDEFWAVKLYSWERDDCSSSELNHSESSELNIDWFCPSSHLTILISSTSLPAQPSFTARWTRVRFLINQKPFLFDTSKAIQITWRWFLSSFSSSKKSCCFLFFMKSFLLFLFIIFFCCCDVLRMFFSWSLPSASRTFFASYYFSFDSFSLLFSLFEIANNWMEVSWIVQNDEVS